jgi:hypothetical protein
VNKLMVSLSDFDLIALVFGETTSTLELIFSASALIGGGLFLLWFVLLLLGGVAEGVFEGLFGLEMDVMSSDGSFDAMTFQGVMAFMMFFGLAGLYTMNSDGSDSLAIAAGAIAGGASMYGTGKIFQVFFALEASGNVEISEAIGVRGSVYLRIPEGGIGQVQIELGGALKTYNAKSEDGQGIATGDFIEVVDTITSTLVVKRV